MQKLQQKNLSATSLDNRRDGRNTLTWAITSVEPILEVSGGIVMAVVSDLSSALDSLKNHSDYNYQ